MAKFSNVECITSYGNLEYVVQTKLTSVEELNEIILIVMDEYRGTVSLFESYIFCKFQEYETAALFKMTWELVHE